MTKDSLLSKAISTVVTLLGAFGSVALNIQPPGEGIQKLLCFIVSFGALIVLLIISAIADTFIDIPRLKKIWISIGIISFTSFLLTGFFYNDKVVKYIVEYPHESSSRYVVGDVLDTVGIKVKSYLTQNHKPITNYNLIQYGGGIDNRKGIWTEPSIDKVTTTLMKHYVFLMILLSISVFSITEGVFRKPNKSPEKKQRSKKTNTLHLSAPVL